VQYARAEQIWPHREVDTLNALCVFFIPRMIPLCLDHALRFIYLLTTLDITPTCAIKLMRHQICYFNFPMSLFKFNDSYKGVMKMVIRFFWWKGFLTHWWQLQGTTFYNPEYRRIYQDPINSLICVSVIYCPKPTTIQDAQTRCLFLLVSTICSKCQRYSMLCDHHLAETVYP